MRAYDHSPSSPAASRPVSLHPRPSPAQTLAYHRLTAEILGVGIRGLSRELRAQRLAAGPAHAPAPSHPSHPSPPSPPLPPGPQAA